MCTWTASHMMMCYENIQFSPTAAQCVVRRVVGCSEPVSLLDLTAIVHIQRFVRRCTSCVCHEREIPHNDPDKLCTAPKNLLVTPFSETTIECLFYCTQSHTVWKCSNKTHNRLGHSLCTVGFYWGYLIKLSFDCTIADCCWLLLLLHRARTRQITTHTRIRSDEIYGERDSERISCALCAKAESKFKLYVFFSVYRVYRNGTVCERECVCVYVGWW